jgi:hypothetical protein
MVTVCAWCQKYMGSREPFGEAKVSHGICDACLERESRSDAPAHVASRDPAGAASGARRAARSPLAV